jgi:putative flippase GtrA
MPALAAFDAERVGLLSRVPAQFLRYAGVSVAALAADTCVYLGLAWSGLSPVAAGAAGYLVGLAAHYVLSVALVFDAEASGKCQRRLVAEFVASGLFGLILTACVISVATGLGLALLPAKIVAVALSFAAVDMLRRSVGFAAR